MTSSLISLCVFVAGVAVLATSGAKIGPIHRNQRFLYTGDTAAVGDIQKDVINEAKVTTKTEVKDDVMLKEEEEIDPVPTKSEETKPRITYSKKVIAKGEDDVVLDCAVEGVNLDSVKDFKIQWSKIDSENPANSLPLTDGEQVIILSHKYAIDHPKESYKYSLKITDVKEGDTGVYRCHVNFGEDQKVHADIPLLIETPAYFLDDYTKVLTVSEFDAISIDCQPGGEPTPDVYWERLHDVLPYYGGQLFKANKLEIPEIKRSHKGHYVCHADNGLADPVMSEVILKVQYKPDVIVKETEIYVGPIQRVTMTCATRAFPEPDVAWYKDDLIVLSSANHRVSKEVLESSDDDLEDQVNLLLTIQEVTAEDYGTYTCKAINIVGTTEASTSLAMKKPPKIIHQSNKEVVYDQEVVLARDSLPLALECEADGQPNPEYLWTKNGAPLVWRADSRFSLEEGTGNLLMVDVTTADNGYYQCTAYNELGTAIADPIKLVNSEQIEFQDVKQDHYDIEAELGRPYQLRCPEVLAYPTPDLTWIKAYDQSESQTKLELIDGDRAVVVDGKLLFTHITEMDDSVNGGFKYMCLGSQKNSPQDMSIGSIVNLAVVDPEDGHNIDEANVQPVLMYKSEDDVTFEAGKSNELWCVFGGEPNPQITWKKEDGELVEGDKYQFANHGKTLVIDDTAMEDEGTYTCTSNNGIGEPLSASMNVTVEVAPTFEKEMASQTVQEGQAVTFYCAVNSTYDLSYEWLFNGRPLVVVEGSRRSIVGNLLTIEKVSAADIGNYACNATSKQGYAYGQAILNVITGSAQSTRHGAPCPSLDGLTTEVSKLREELMELRHMIQDHKQNQDHTLIDLMQRIVKVLPENKLNVKQKTSSLFGAITDDELRTAGEDVTELPVQDEEEDMTTTLPPSEE